MTTKIPVELSSTPGIVDGSNATAITIDSSENSTFAGNVKSPRYILDGTDSATTRYIFTDNTNTGDGRLIIQSGGGSGGYGGAINLYSHAHASKPGDVVAGISSGSSGSFRVNTTGIDTGSDVFIVKANGNVGIGTTSPNDKLHIKIGTNLNWQFGYPNSSVTTLAALNDAESAYVEGRIDASALTLNSQSGGNVGIGTTSPSQSLSVQATGGTVAEFLGEGGPHGIKIYGNDAGFGAIGHVSSGSYDLAINSSGVVAIPAGIELGSGADFTAANILDDYEEGTWSPQLVGSSGSAGTYAQSATTAVYTKIGNRVFFNCTFYVTNKGSYSGTSVITGLPFTNNGNTTAVSTGSFPDSGYGTTSGNVLIVGQVESSGTRIIFYEGSRLDVQHAYADVGTGYYINVAGNYMTNS